MTLVEDLAIEAFSRLEPRHTLSGARELPGPWSRRGRCRTVSPEIFFPERGDSTRQAREICGGCPVKEECLEYGLTERFGIWGGTSERERRELRRQRGIAIAEDDADTPPPRPPLGIAATDLFTVLEQLTEHPNRWASVVRYESPTTASATASGLRSGVRPSPPGRWEFEGRRTPDGSAVYARYLGPAEAAAS